MGGWCTGVVLLCGDELLPHAGGANGGTEMPAAYLPPSPVPIVTFAVTACCVGGEAGPPVGELCMVAPVGELSFGGVFGTFPSASSIR